MKYRVSINDASLQFNLPDASKDGQSTEEDCGDELDGKIKFVCNEDKGRWKIDTMGCKAKEATGCRATNYRIKFPFAKLKFSLDDADVGDKVSVDCSELGKFKGQAKFVCTAQKGQDPRFKLDFKRTNCARA